MAILKLKPACKDYLWGGHKIREKYHIESDAEPFAEAWILSANEKGPSIIENGEYAGMSFREYCETHPEAVGLNPVITGEFRGVSGESGVTTERFPVLIKFLDAKQSLSLQVHPDDNTAHLLNRDAGKTEFIYILEAEEGAELIYGLEKEISFREWRERVYTRKVLDVVHHQKVKAGEGYFVPAGTVHGYGAGILALEIQQNSDVTYRIFDYDRVGKDGKHRPLHLQEAAMAANPGPVPEDFGFDGHLVSCPFFTVDRFTEDFEEYADSSSYVSLVITEGSFTIKNGAEEVAGKPGESFFLPAGSGKIEVRGKGEIFRTRT